jgi:DNA-binding TFAR19-related protein (PDSD5 family)
MVVQQIVSLAMQGKLPGKINEPKLIEFLERAEASAAKSTPAEQRISIQRKKYAFDEDSDDDNDDDLV